MRKQVSCILHKLGFKFEETDNDLRFDYEGIHMLIMFTDDENYLSILVPGILDADKDNELTVLRGKGEVFHVGHAAALHICARKLVVREVGFGFRTRGDCK